MNCKFISILTFSLSACGTSHVAKIHFIGKDLPAEQVAEKTGDKIIRRSCFDGGGNIGVAGIIEKTFEENPNVTALSNVSIVSEKEIQGSFMGTNAIRSNCLVLKATPLRFK